MIQIPATCSLRRTIWLVRGPSTVTTMSWSASLVPNRTTSVPTNAVVIAISRCDRSATSVSARASAVGAQPGRQQQKDGQSLEARPRPAHQSRPTAPSE